MCARLAQILNSAFSRHRTAPYVGSRVIVAHLSSTGLEHTLCSLPVSTSLDLCHFHMVKPGCVAVFAQGKPEYRSDRGAGRRCPAPACRRRRIWRRRHHQCRLHGACSVVDYPATACWTPSWRMFLHASSGGCCCHPRYRLLCVETDGAAAEGVINALQIWPMLPVVRAGYG